MISSTVSRAHSGTGSTGLILNQWLNLAIKPYHIDARAWMGRTVGCFVVWKEADTAIQQQTRVGVSRRRMDSATGVDQDKQTSDRGDRL